MRQSVFCLLLLVTVLLLAPLPAAGWSIYIDYWLDSSPVVGFDGTIFAVGAVAGGVGGKIHALNPDGTKKWEFQSGSQITTSPAVSDNEIIYFGTLSGCIGLNKNGKLHNVFDTDEPVKGSPAIDSKGNTYFVTTDPQMQFGTIYCVNPEGVILWENNKVSLFSPALDETNGIVYVAGEDGYLTAYDTSDGSTRWKVLVEEPVSGMCVGPDGTVSLRTTTGTAVFLVSVTPWGTRSVVPIDPDSTLNPAVRPGPESKAQGEGASYPVIDVDGTFYFGNSNKFYAFTRSGAKKWDFTAGGEITGTAAIGADGTIYFGSADGRINMLNRSGTLVGWFDAGSAIQGSPTLAPNGMLYFGAADGKLYGLETGSPGLAKSAWPMYMHDPRHTGRAAKRIALPFLNLLLSGN